MVTIITFTISYFLIAFLFLFVSKLYYRKKFKNMAKEDRENYNDNIIWGALLFPVTIIISIIYLPFLICEYIIKTFDKFNKL